MTWKCPKCSSNDVRYRSLTWDYRCNRCRHIMSTCPQVPRSHITGKPPKFLKVRQ